MQIECLHATNGSWDTQASCLNHQVCLYQSSSVSRRIDCHHLGLNPALGKETQVVFTHSLKRVICLCIWLIMPKVS